MDEVHGQSYDLVNQVFLWQHLVLIVSVVHVHADNTVQTWPLASSASALSVKWELLLPQDATQIKDS